MWWLANADRFDEYETAQNQGFHVRALDHVPEIPERLVRIWNGYIALSRRRPPSARSGVPGAIPFAEIKAWLDEQGFDEDERERVAALLEKLDVATVQYYVSAEKSEKRRQDEQEKRERNAARRAAARGGG